MKHKVLSTKKLDPLLIEKAKQNGIEITEKEFISVKHDASLKKFEEVFNWMNAGKEYMVFTSANAVISFQNYVNRNDTIYVAGWKIFCLSGNTKDELDKPFGRVFGTVIEMAENAKSLAEKIITHGVEEIIFFCGNKRRDELPGILKNAGVTVHEVVVYETVETPSMATKNFNAILFFSPSAVNSFFSVNQLMKDTVCFAIGQTTADVIADFTDNTIIVSEWPRQESMLATVELYFNNKECFPPGQ